MCSYYCWLTLNYISSYFYQLSYYIFSRCQAPKGDLAVAHTTRAPPPPLLPGGGGLLILQFEPNSFEVILVISIFLSHRKMNPWIIHYAPYPEFMPNGKVNIQQIYWNIRDDQKLSQNFLWTQNLRAVILRRLHWTAYIDSISRMFVKSSNQRHISAHAKLYWLRVCK